MYALIAAVIFFGPTGPEVLAEIVMKERFSTVEECVAYSEEDGWGNRVTDAVPIMVSHTCDVAPRLVE